MYKCGRSIDIHVNFFRFCIQLVVWTGELHRERWHLHDSVNFEVLVLFFCLLECTSVAGFFPGWLSCPGQEPDSVTLSLRMQGRAISERSKARCVAGVFSFVTWIHHMRSDRFFHAARSNP